MMWIFTSAKVKGPVNPKAGVLSFLFFTIIVIFEVLLEINEFGDILEGKNKAKSR